MKKPQRKRLDHESPDWVPSDADYFITICGEPRHLNQFSDPVVGPEVLKSIANYHDRGKWFCHLAVLMPDHVHLLLAFPDIPLLTKTIGHWKAWLCHHHHISWQENFFEHRLRNDENMKQKADYILQNPVRAGLIERPEDWPYVWLPES